MAVLSTNELKEALENEEPRHRLVVTPLLDADRQVDDSTIDIRLGTELITLQRSELESILGERPSGRDEGAGFRSRDEVEREIDQVSEEVHVPFGHRFLVHPGQFVLGCSLEYIGIPEQLLAYIVARSSWARLGLVIETAMLVAPGFRGVITFELTNVGNVPIGIYPGTRIAQLALHRVPGSSTEYAKRSDAKYRLPTGPEFSRIYKDADWDLLDGVRHDVA